MNQKILPPRQPTFGAFADTMMAWGDAIHRKSRQLKTALEEITDPDELRGLDIISDWPSNNANDYLPE